MTATKPPLSAEPQTDAIIDSCGDYEKPHKFIARFEKFARRIERENISMRADNYRLRDALIEADDVIRSYTTLDDSNEVMQQIKAALSQDGAQVKS